MTGYYNKETGKYDLMRQLQDMADARERMKDRPLPKLGVTYNPKMYFKHIIYTYKGKVYTHHKDWDFQRIEMVLTRLGAEDWEIGF